MYSILFFLLCLTLGGCTQEYNKTVTNKNSTMNESIELGFVGDVMLGRLTNEIIQQKGPRSIWGTMLPLLQSCDCVIANLETALTRSTTAVPKVFNFKADPNVVDALSLAHICAVNNANNHILDFDVEGLRETIQTLNDASIAHVGAGENISEAQKPAYITINNTRIAHIGITDNEPTWHATDTKPGTYYCDMSTAACAKVADHIKKIRADVDMLIISVHWGSNWATKPPENFISCAHAWIDAGADIIHGHSAHIFQGIELYNNKIIMYGLGDFIDDYAIDETMRNDYAILAKLSIRNKKMHTLTIYPAIIESMHVNVPSASDSAIILERIKNLSAENGAPFSITHNTLVLHILN
ncbi:MAG TPA: CapA family protein [Candidatus Babeliales bacterium]|jgi:poly-gamma-glutamate synthesis protein (capsule biosynthesis protein)|nr:CapA family protein [Candidatus Babeliales bacterium]